MDIFALNILTTTFAKYKDIYIYINLNKILFENGFYSLFVLFIFTLK